VGQKSEFNNQHIGIEWNWNLKQEIQSGTSEDFLFLFYQLHY